VTAGLTVLATVAGVVAPVVLMALAGFVWARSGRDWPVAFVGRLATGLAVPCLVFTALTRAEVAAEALAAVALAAAAGYGALTVVFLGLARVLGLDPRTYVVPLTFGNTGNLGLPLALLAFGEAGLALAVAVFAVGVIWQFSFGVWLVTGGGPGQVAREPMVWASLAGGVCLWQGWQPPAVIGDTLALAGQMAIPLMLLTLGVAVARLRPGRLPLAAGLSVLRLAVCLAVAAAVAGVMAPDRTAFAVLVLQLSMPVPVTAYLLALRAGRDADAVAGLVLASTLLGLVALPATLAIFL
jgi:predicted permease